MEGKAREEAIRAYKLGWSLIPLKEDSKLPNLPKGHEFLHRKPTPAEYRAFKFQNYGIVTGPVSGICVLDIDSPDGLATLAQNDWFVVFDIETPRVKTPRGTHIYFKYDERIGTSASKLGPGLDVRSKGGYVVGPGCSVSGIQYVWDDVFDGDTELADPPSWMWQSEARAELNGDYWKMPEKVREGGRNNKLTSLAGALVLRDIPFPVMAETMKHINQIWFEPPLSDEEVYTIAASIERKR